MSEHLTREGVEALIARLRNWPLSAPSDRAEAASALTSLLALAYDKDTGEAYIERAAISEELRREALARLAEVEKALEPFAAIKPSYLYPADGSENEGYFVFLADRPGHTDVTGADLARARAALHPKGE